VIAVCLLTCDRYECTVETLRTFSAHNALDRFAALLHADDASTDGRVLKAARRYRFETVARTRERRGWLEMRRRLFVEAAKRAPWILFLENDIEWARPFPWALFEWVSQYRQFYCLRLQGAYKDRARRDAFMVHHKKHRELPVTWKRLKYAPEKAEAARIHWSAQPCVTRAEHLLAHHFFGTEARELTVRVVKNVAFHMGAPRTTRLEVRA
jgi:hypothetical protein